MSDFAIHSINALAHSDTVEGWRIACAIVPIAFADLAVTREEARELSPARVLLLETIQLLEEVDGGATVANIAELSGIGDKALMAGILLPLADQGLVLVEGVRVRQHPTLTIRGQEARVVVEKEERVCVIGTPPVPVYGIEQQRVKRLRAFDADADSISVSDDTLEAWRTTFWNARTRRLRLREPLQSRLFVLEGCANGKASLNLCDELNSVRVSLPDDHPLLGQLLEGVRPILQAAADLLKPYGLWSEERTELCCTAEQWRRWRDAGGHDVSEVLVRGSIDVAIKICVRPADAAAARLMLMAFVTEELDASSGPCTTEHVESIAIKQRHRELLRGHDLPIPKLSEIEAVAWDSGRWELAYRIARVADGL